MVQFKLPNESTSLLASTEASFPRFTPINSFISCSPISLHAPAPYSLPHWHECQLESPTQAAQRQCSTLSKRASLLSGPTPRRPPPVSRTMFISDGIFVSKESKSNRARGIRAWGWPPIQTIWGSRRSRRPSHKRGKAVSPGTPASVNTGSSVCASQVKDHGYQG